MPWTWTEQTELAAALVAAGNLSFDEIAARVGVTRKTLASWRTKPDFKARVDEELAEFRDEVRRLGIGTVEKRVAALNDLHTRLRLVIEARADDPRMASVPGGSTGLLTVVSIKQLGTGDGAELVSLFGLDVGLVREIREVQKQAAIELGQWQNEPNSGEVDMVAVHKLLGQRFDDRRRRLESGEIDDEQYDREAARDHALEIATRPPRDEDDEDPDDGRAG